MRAAGYAILTTFGMAAFTLLLRATLQTWPVGTAGSLSRIVTLAALGAWVVTTGEGWRRLHRTGVVRWLALMGAISIAINLLLFGSLKWTTATNNALLFRLDLVFVVLIGSLLGLERIGAKQLLVLPVMLFGAGLVSELQKFSFHGHMVGDLMVAGAAFCFAVNAFIIRRILRSMDEEAVALYNHGISTLGFVVLAVANREFVAAREVMMTPSAWIWLALLGLAAAVVLPLYYAALRRMSVWRLRTWLLATPVLVAVPEWGLWGTRPTVTQGLGGVLVLAGLAILIRLESRDAPEGRRTGGSPPAPRGSTSATSDFADEATGLFKNLDGVHKWGRLPACRQASSLPHLAFRIGPKYRAAVVKCPVRSGFPTRFHSGGRKQENVHGIQESLA
jgi:drug/metabolite transporter (DMT)-like permease